MRQILAVLLVLALIGSTLAKGKGNKWRTQRETPERRAIRPADRFRENMGKAEELRKEYAQTKSISTQQKAGLDTLRRKFADFKPNMPQLNEFRNKMANGAQMAAAAQKKSFLNAKALKSTIKKAMKKEIRS